MSTKIVQGRCGECGKDKPLPCHHPNDDSKGRVCGNCYKRLANPVGPCGECGDVKRLPSHHPTDEAKGRVCSACYQRLIRSTEPAPGNVEEPAGTGRISA